MTLESWVQSFETKTVDDGIARRPARAHPEDLERSLAAAPDQENIRSLVEQLKPGPP